MEGSPVITGGGIVTAATGKFEFVTWNATRKIEINKARSAAESMLLTFAKLSIKKTNTNLK
jgi:hypothetical protein